MFCTNCGAKLSDGVKFCTECGSKVLPKVNPEHTASKPETPAVEQPAEPTTADNTVDIILSAVGPSKMEVIKLFKEVTGSGLKDAKAAIDAVEDGTSIKIHVPEAEAKNIKERFAAAGAAVAIADASEHASTAPMPEVDDDAIQAQAFMDSINDAEVESTPDSGSGTRAKAQIAQQIPQKANDTAQKTEKQGLDLKNVETQSLLISAIAALVVLFISKNYTNSLLASIIFALIDFAVSYEIYTEVTVNQTDKGGIVEPLLCSLLVMPTISAIVWVYCKLNVFAEGTFDVILISIASVILGSAPFGWVRSNFLIKRIIHAVSGCKYSDTEQEQKDKQDFVKALIGAVVSVVVITFIMNTSAIKSKGISIGKIPDYSSSISVGKALDREFDNGAWDNYVKDGEQYVTYTGDYDEGNLEFECKITFIKREGSVEINEILINGEDLGMLWYSDFLQHVYDQDPSAIADLIASSALASLFWQAILAS